MVQNENPGLLNDLIKKEKEALLSMFLANATIEELSAQYRLIDELNKIISLKNCANQGDSKTT